LWKDDKVGWEFGLMWSLGQPAENSPVAGAPFREKLRTDNILVAVHRYSRRSTSCSISLLQLPLAAVFDYPPAEDLVRFH
jgi:hypothetical protein